MHRAGAVLLERLLNSDRGGHAGQRIDCCHGHQAVFIDYRRKQVQTILGDVQLRRAYYHCADCLERDGGVIPKDRELDVVDTSFSPGMRRLMARVGAQEAFAAARQDLAELAGVRVHTKSVERISEAMGEVAETANRAERLAIVAGQVTAGAEPARKTVIGQRLKHSGMRWTVAGANAIIALRCRLLGHRWEDLWNVAA